MGKCVIYNSKVLIWMMINNTHLQQVADLLFGQFSCSFGNQSLHFLSLHLNTHTQMNKIHLEIKDEENPLSL